MNDCFGQLDLKIEASHAEQPNVERQTDRKYVTSLSKLTPKMARFSEASSLTLMPSQQILVQIKELACECRRGLRGIGIGCRAFWACGVADMADEVEVLLHC